MMYQRSARLMEAELGDELVGLDVERGYGYSFNALAAHIWRLLETPTTLPDLTAALLEEYDVDPATCDREVRALLAQFQKDGLVSVFVA